MKVNIPQNVQSVLSLLRTNGFRALPVGGCVRDTLRGVEPHDWDITTSATPDEMLEVFAELRVRRIGQAGIKHGTITVIIDHEPIEVTTFRSDGKYSDGRRPDCVCFSRKLSDDLSRRDFTINALCIDENGETVDMFGGKEDIENKIIRAIGDPDKRFKEDALRILRALRFAACFGYTIEENTAARMLANTERLKLLASERVSDELIKLICAPDCLRILLLYKDIICGVLPELKAAVGMHQREDYHCYDVYEHIVHSVAAAPANPLCRLTMLLHDIGKPAVADGNGHFYRHEMQSVKTAEGILKRFNCGKQMRERILFAVGHHHLPIYPLDEARARKLLAKYGEAAVKLLFEVNLADVSAQRPDIADERKRQLDKALMFLNNVIAQRPALAISQLAIGGNDILALGIEQGPQVGLLLKESLELVIDKKLENTKQALLSYIKAKQ